MTDLTSGQAIPPSLLSGPDLSIQIQMLRNLRLDVASSSQALSERELDGRLLRAKLEEELVATGIARTPAEKQAKVNPQYLNFERTTIALTFERERVLAEAEAALLNIKLQLAVLERTQL